MINFFNRNRSFVIFFLPVLALFPGGIGIINSESIITPKSMPFFNALTFILPESPWFLSLLSLIAIILIAVVANNIVTTFDLQKNTFLPALFYMLFLLSYKSYVFLTPLLITNGIIILIINDILSLGKEEGSLNPIFRAGFLIGIASLFYFPACAYLLLVFIAISLFRIHELKEWGIALSAFLIPWLFVLTFYFLTDHLEVILKQIQSGIQIGFFLKSSIHKLYFYILFIPLFIISILQFQFKNSAGNIKLRKNKIIIFWFIIITIGIFFLSNSHWIDFMALLALPVSIVFSNFFTSFRKPLVGEIIFWIFYMGITYNIFISKFTNL